MVFHSVLLGLLRLMVIFGVMFSGGWERPSPALASVTLYLPQPGSPTAIPNFVNPNAGCNWWGIGGQAFNEAGRPEPGLIVRIRGVVDGVTIDRQVVSGSALSFGPGGFEMQIASRIPASATMSAQVFDTAGRPLSGYIPLPFYSTCSQNLLALNLRQRTFTRFVYIPWVRR